ncbi:MAG: hypothetical protein ACRDE2_00235 [Chitinophagaceae bacterium]
MTELEKIVNWLESLGHKVDKDLAKIAIIAVADIQPLIFSGVALTAADILDTLTKSKFPEEILNDLKKWLPIFLVTEGLVTSISSDSTEQEVLSDLDKLVAEFPKQSWLQHTKIWNNVAAQIYVLLKKVGEGEKIPWSAFSALIQNVYNDMQSEGLIK